MEENVPQIKLANLTQEKIDNIAEGVKIFDIDTNKYYEKRNGSFQPIIEEVEEDGKEEPPVPINQCDVESIRKMVASGDKHLEVNTFMRLKTAKNELITQRGMLTQKVIFMFNGTPEQIDTIQIRVSDITEEAINNASLEELRQFFEFEGSSVTLNLEEVLDEKEITQAHREFLLYLKSLSSVDNDIDAQIREIDMLCEEFSDEVKEKSKNVYEWDNYIYDIFRERLTREDISADERQRIERLLRIKDEATSLKPLYDALKEEIDLGRKKSLITAFKTRFEDTLAKASKYAESKGFHIYFQLFDGIEEHVGYGDYKNLFAYIFARYVKYHRETFTKADNAFIAQILQNAIMLKKDQLREPSKSLFINGIKDILELVITD